jgi:hypothetical protein
MTRRFPAAGAIAVAAFVATLSGAGPAGAADQSDRQCSPGLVPATAAAVFGHVEKAHLERSPMTQVHDARQTGDYVAMHRAWVEAFTGPAGDGAVSVAGASSSRAVSHAQQSPGSARGASDPDAFILQQTTWLQSVLDPGEDVLTGRSC